MTLKVSFMLLILCSFALYVHGVRKRVISPRKSQSLMKENPSSTRRQRARTEVISCRVFKRGTCKQTKRNIISSSTSVKNKGGCQQLCFATTGCAGFTFYEGRKKKCMLFHHCKGERGKCTNCISGPIMPRITECLLGRQMLSSQIEPEPQSTCPAGCQPVGQSCPGSDLYEVDYVDEEKLSEVTESTTATDDDYSFDTYDNEVDTEDYEYDYYDYEEQEVDLESTLEEDAIQVEEEEEDVDLNIDDGFLNDENDEPIELPSLTTRTALNTSYDAPLFFFVIVGGIDANGSTISLIDLLNTGLGNSAQGLSIAPLPSVVTQGGSCSSAYTKGSITSCGRGVRSLSPYGFQYNPGSCYSYGLETQRWEARGGKMKSFRRGASVTKLGRYMLVTGGLRQKRALNSMEVFDPSRPKVGWKNMGLKMPIGVSGHCTVVLGGKRGKEVVITGGSGRGGRAFKLNLNSKRWYSLNEMKSPRKDHACVKVTLNGHPGVIVSGGSSGDSSLSTVEFYNAKTGEWLKMPNLKRGRSGHAMTITNGKLMVAGGLQEGRSGKRVLDDVEIFNGKSWVTSRDKMRRPRSGFSLLKVPKQKTLKKRKRFRKN